MRQMRRSAGDRRLKPRFEIVGELGGTLETVVTLALRDASHGGVLTDSPVPLPIGSIHRIRLHCDELQATVRVAVRHVRPVTAFTGEARYLIGFEFATHSPSLQDVVDRWMVAHGGTAS